MDRVGKRAKKAVAATEKEFDRLVNDLGKKSKVAEKKLMKIVSKREAIFKDLKLGFESAAKEIDKSVKTALKRIK